MRIFEASLLSWTDLEIKVDDLGGFPNFDFKIGDKIIFGTRYYENGNTYRFKLAYNQELLGNYIHIQSQGEDLPVDVTKLPKQDNFDYYYAYDGDDLGPVYHKDHTSFALWAPLAHKVVLKIKGNDYLMTRTDKGVYRLSLDGDLHGELYNYIVYINDQEIETIDPYAKSGNANNVKSCVVDLDLLKGDSFDEYLPEFKNKLDAIIYEGHIRDLTSHKSTDIVNKGKYLGLIEKGRKTRGGNPAGFDYLSSLGFTHIQLLPVLDFGSVDETKPDHKYNWGYDPMHFFTLEGSYSTNPDDPLSRMKEFTRLVQTFHRSRIRVNLDVVYNHVFYANKFALARITPNYFYRFEGNRMSNHSFCGNDFASERAMARKVIVDSVKFLIEQYHVDGFRFDLMGLIDLETIQKVYEVAKSIRPDVMIYGEGWDMCCVSEFDENIKFANMKNHALLPGVSFFNDSYRNIMRGHGGKAVMEENGFLLGNLSYIDGAKFALLASCVKTIYPPIFTTVDQSLNYVECHDNATIYDIFNESIDCANTMRHLKLFNKVLMFSPGIPFVHSGQEIGCTKHSQHNTYNMGDYYNQFDYDLLDKRMDIVSSFKAYIIVRKTIGAFKINDPAELEKVIEFKNNNGVLDMKIKPCYSQNCTYHVFINASDKPVKLEGMENMELYVPYSLRDYPIDINFSDTGIVEHKCSICKEKQ